MIRKDDQMQARIEWVLLEILLVFHWIDPFKDSQNFVEKAQFPMQLH